MRTAAAFLALGALASAQQQVPLADQVKGWFAKASSAVNSFGSAASATAAASIPNPVNAGAAAVAASQVHPLTLENYKATLAPGAATASPGIEDWMIYVTGGNKSCYGLCENADREWNKSVPLLSATKGSPRLASIDCEAERVLCHAWSASPPSILYLRVPQPQADQSQAPTEIRYINLNRTAIAASEIAELYTKDGYKKTEVYEGFWHPFDGTLAKANLNIPFGYAIYYFSLVPSWAFMIGISMLSRTVMSRRMAPPPQQRRPQQGGAQARPAAASK
ncbi:hypothetical protein K461DRAFT_277152 [Myriangium duriaei CBS 260.36]|uniref:Peptidyl-tRNA hydrolase n=1 Tax=Myriangium duriaei CBS 260.36 TaxID=1168546 RepID=A0A9P4J7X5_9PEZI|nr:hypothetical protein K461DRAFT_277152 [Myriangium duriaei CBS 260.36]